MFEQELEFFINNQEALVAKYNGKILAIKHNEVVAVYDTLLEDYLKSQEKFPLGSVMLQLCIPGEEAYSSRIYVMD